MKRATMPLHVALFLLTSWKLSQSHHLTNISQQDNIISNKSHIICDGGISNDSCIGKTIICADGFDCEIVCERPNNRRIRRSLLSTTETDKCISETSGCCATDIYCPYGKKCDIICGGACKETTIYAKDSSYLEIKHCNKIPDTHWSTCHSLTIHCPLHGPCEFDGDFALQMSYIHTLRGFYDIYLENGLLLDLCVIFCGVDPIRDAGHSENNCVSNDIGTKCVAADNIDICKNIDSNTTWYWYYNESHSDEEYNSQTDTGIYKKESIRGLSAYFDPNNKFQMIGYGAIIVLLLLPILIVIIAVIHHSHLEGSDSPQYLAVFKCFINIADLYTDIMFCICIFLSGAELMFYSSFVFTALPHIISVIAAMCYVHKWKENRITYIKRYDNLVIGLTVLCGFVPTIELLSSKLFYAPRLTLQICDMERLRIQQFRFINNNILENIPLIIIQVLTTINTRTDINPITIVAFCFSTLSAIIGILTLLSRCFDAFLTKSLNNKFKYKLMYKLDLKSNAIQIRHYYCHKLFAECLCQAMETDDGRIETISIIPIVDGISCKIEILSNINDHENNNNIHALLNEIADNKSEAFEDFKRSLGKLLCIIELECDDLQVIITKLDSYGEIIDNENESINDNMPTLKRRTSVYMPLRRTSLGSLDNINIKINREGGIGIDKNRLCVNSCGDMIGEGGNNQNYEKIEMIETDEVSDCDQDGNGNGVEYIVAEIDGYNFDTTEDETEDETDDDGVSIDAVKGSRHLSYEFSFCR